MEDGKVPPDKLDAFAGILQATAFEPITVEQPYTEEYVTELMTKKAAKVVA